MSDGVADRLPRPLRSGFILLRDTAQEFSDDKAARLAAALAYYAAFSLAPLLLVVIALVGFFWEAEEAQVQARIISELSDLIGQDGAGVIQTMLEGAAGTGSGVVATIAGIGGLIWGATRLFAQLQGALNDIWNVQPRPGRGIMGFVTTRVLSFGMVLVLGLLLLFALIVSAVLSALSEFITEYVSIPYLVLEVANQGASLTIVTLLFAAIYRYLPDVEIAWRDVWIGAFITAALFNLGKYGISVYLSTTGTASAYGAAGSFVLLLLWIYFSSIIFFFGAEFTQVYARHYGHRIDPSPHAMRVDTISVHELDTLRAAQAAREPSSSSPEAASTDHRPAMWKRALPIVAAFVAGRIFTRRD